ncbi:MAG: NPCBM/NEW2 domain-containing protein [Planctomycetota bacterium]
MGFRQLFSLCVVLALPTALSAAEIETVDALIPTPAAVGVNLGSTPPTLTLPGREIPLRDVLRIGWTGGAPLPARFKIELIDGSELVGNLVSDAPEESIRLIGGLFQKPRDIPLESIRRIERRNLPGGPRPRGPQAEASDRLYPLSGGSVEGLVLEVRSSGVKFEDEKLGEITFEWEKIASLELAALEEAPSLADDAIAVALEGPSGSRLLAQLDSLDAREVQVTSPLLGKVAASLREVSGLVFLLGRLEYLSNRDPVEVEQGVEPALMDPETFAHFCGWQRDRSVEKTPLVIGTKSFRKGLGVHSNCKLVYAVKPGDRTFQSWIGIDVEGHPPTQNPEYGSVVFRVLVDGEEKVREAINWEQPARRVQVSLAGASRLELIVEEGPGLHICDRADWGDARIIRD